MFQLSVAKNRTILSLIQPILGHCLPQIQILGSKSYLLKKFQTFLMKNKSTLLKIRKNENFLYLGNPWRKKFMQNILFFKKFEESVVKISGKSEYLSALVVKGLLRTNIIFSHSRTISNEQWQTIYRRDSLWDFRTFIWWTKTVYKLFVRVPVVNNCADTEYY